MYTYCSRWSGAAVSRAAARTLFILIFVIARKYPPFIYWSRGVWIRPRSRFLFFFLRCVTPVRFSLCERCRQRVTIGASAVWVKCLKTTADVTLCMQKCPHIAIFSLFLSGISKMSSFRYVADAKKKKKKGEEEEEKKKGKNGWITNRLFQLHCSFCLSFSRATLLKIGVMIVCVCVCVCVSVRVCVCKSVYVCLHRCQKNPALCTTCACAERANASGSPLENSAAPRSASLFIITVWNKAWIMQTAGTRLYVRVAAF